MSPVIEFDGVSKRFALAEQSGMLGSLLDRLRPGAARGRELWALRDVSFAVNAGESVGLIGHNGSGKSTLLKLATRIIRPTSGRVTVDGRIGALLELGAGFHPDLSGRENIYLNGSVLGLSNRQIDDRLDAIVDFSELEAFIDVPVKHYSSGMYMRLGFSVAVHCDPDVLLIDEILAVGDRAFQQKCVRRIGELQRQNVTLLIVSHHLETVRKLCSRLVWMEQGVLRMAGPTEEVTPYYVENMNSRSGGEGIFERAGSHEAEIVAVNFLDSDGNRRMQFQTGEPMTIEMQVVAHQPIDNPEMGFAIFRDDGVHISGSNHRLAGIEIDRISGEGSLRYHIDRLPLLPGGYRVSAAIQDGLSPRIYDFHTQAYSFRVAPGGTQDSDGVISMPADWEWRPDGVNARAATS